MSSVKIEDTKGVHGQTISFRYFVEKKVKPRTYFWKGKRYDSYPLYIQINVKQKMTQRRSILDVYIPDELIGEYVTNHAAAVTEEIDALRERVLLFKPFERADFNLKEALDGYSALQEDICSLVGMLLRVQYQEARRQDSIEQMINQGKEYSLPETISIDPKLPKDQVESRMKDQANDIFFRGELPSQIINPIAVFAEVRDLAVEGKPAICTLYHKYDKHLWNLDRYCYIMREQCSYTIITRRILLSPTFKDQFVSLLGNNIYVAVSQSVNFIIEASLSLKEDS